MNIFEELYNINKGNLSKTALSIRLENNTERSYTYGEMFDRAILFSQMLQSYQVRGGDRVAIMAESCPEWNIVYLAITHCKATAVLLDATLDQKSLLDLLEKSHSCCLFASPGAMAKMGDTLKIPIFNLLEAPCPYSENSSKTPASLGQTATVGTGSEGDEKVSTLIFSSGTTKKASGILHSHDALLLSSKMCMESNQLRPDDRLLAVLPNSHIYGLVCQLVGPLMLGAHICFLENLNAQSLAGVFQNFRPSIFPAVPKMCELLRSQILQKVDSDPKTQKLFALFFPICLKLRQTYYKINLGKILFKKVHHNFGGQLRIICSAGAPLSTETAAFFYGLGFDILATYGATETSIPTIGNCPGRITTHTCGLPYPGIQVKISASGELLIKTPYRMLGYLDDPQATQQAFDSEGWFRSGDLGSMDAKGRVCILGRCKENIVLATGKKIAPDDIEAAYAGIEGMAELVVCGIPVANGSYDEIHAFIVASPAQVDSVKAQLQARSAGLSQNLKLMGIHWVETIPRTALQKPKRYLLKQMVDQQQAVLSPEIADDPQKSLSEAVLKVVGEVAHRKVTDFNLDTKLFSELAIDSLGTLDLACQIQKLCGFRVDHLLFREMTVGQLMDCALLPAGQCPRHAEDMTQYPKLKHQMEYNIFCLVRKLFRSIYRVEVKNEGVLPENSGYIICANHVSNFDYLYLTLNFKKERFSKFCCMAKKELFHNNWLSKSLTNICGMIPVDRSGLVTEAMLAIQLKLKEKWGVLIHPEGTRSETGQLGTFKNGAAVLAIEANVPVIPAYIKGGYEIYPRSRKLPQIFDWKRMHKYQVEVIYGAPIFPKGLSVEELMKTIEVAVTGLSTPPIQRGLS